MSDLALR